MRPNKDQNELKDQEKFEEQNGGGGKSSSSTPEKTKNITNYLILGFVAVVIIIALVSGCN